MLRVGRILICVHTTNKDCLLLLLLLLLLILPTLHRLPLGYRATRDHVALAQLLICD